MKQLCNNCGRRFDAELTDGICPYCGRYLSLSQEEQAQQEQKKPEKESEQQPDPKQEEKTKKERQQEKARREQEKKRQHEEAIERLRRDQQQRERERKETKEKEKQKEINKGQKKWTLCIVLLVLLAIVQLVKFFHKQPEKQPEAQQENGVAIQEEMYSLGDVIKVGPMEKEITISQPQVMENMRGLDEQDKMVRVYCEADKIQQYANSMDMKWFLEVDDKYYNAVNSYDMERVYPEMEKEMLEDDTLKSSAMDAGWVYFVVPRDMTAGTLWIGERPLNDDYDIEGDILMRGMELEFTETGALK